MDYVAATLLDKGFSARFYSFSALDRYCGLKSAPNLWMETNADLTALSREFGNLRFPGPDIADAAIDIADTEKGTLTYFFRCLGEDDSVAPFFDLLTFAWDAAKKSYSDPDDLYPLVRSLRDGKRRDPESPHWHQRRRDTVGRTRGGPRAAAEAALILSRYSGALEETADEEHERVPAELIACLNRLPEMPRMVPEEQRILLTGLMTAPRPYLGLRLLQKTGFLETHWPELAAMDEVDHSKEFHPEGNAWDHTLETFRYRKIADETLSLGLLLHDSGKPLAEASGGRRFDRHAELGEQTARAFLGRLGFSTARVDDVAFLVRNHMMPAALPRLPLTRTQTALESPLFPLLLELYRCDESSSFKNQGGFYESCAAYRAYLRNVKNPYRSADGKKLMKRLFHD
ncbi:MAG: phosphohydrolase [Treponemataceae bacterium]